MSDNDFLEQRRAALEDEFFHKENEKKLAKLREQLTATETREELRKASGMSDDAVLDKLVALGLRGATIAALSLVPLVAVAWADNELDDDERRHILNTAAGKNMEPGSAGYELLTSWLAKPPAPTMLDAWEGYMKALMDQLNDEQVRMLKTQVVDNVKHVANAAGGFLGFGKVSSSEQQVIDRIEAVFSK